MFSNVGMVPSILAGLDVKKIHEGAVEEIKHQANFDFLKIAQLFLYQKVKPSLTNSVIMTYSDALFNFGKLECIERVVAITSTGRLLR